MNLQDRVRNILTRPAAEWSVIAAEPADVATLYRSYILPLAAIPAIGMLIGLSMVGSMFTGGFGVAFAVRAAIAAYVSTLVGTIIAAFVVEKLAPSFGSHGDTAQALKLVAYATTPVWIAGILYIFVILTPLILLAALYAIYLFYLGLGPVMHTPPDKTVGYMIVSAIVVIVVNLCVQLLMRAIVPGPMYF
jgi:hypothetical protein